MVGRAASLLQGKDPMGSPVFWRAVADSVPDMLLLVDGAARITYINRVPEGHDTPGVIGSSVFDYVPSESRHELELSLADSFRGGAPRMREQRGVHSDGTERWYQIHSGPVTIEGKVVAAIIAVRDVTEATRDKMLLADSEARCRILSKLASGIGHDFNNLLTVISGTAHCVADDETTPQSIREDVNAILVETKRAAALTAQLLTFAKRQIPPNEVIDLNEVVRHMGKAARRVIPHRIEHTDHLAPGPMLVAVNRSRLEQVIMNLLLNARDAISEKGVIKVHTRHLPAHVSLVVTDNGSGMTEETRSQVLKAFFTTKAELGSGLGLSTVNSIVTDACGTLSIASAAGEGTTVEIILPRADLSTSASHHPNARPTA